MIRRFGIQTTNVQVLLAALECGLSTTALFPSDNAALAEEWRKVGRFTPLALTDDGTVTEEDGDFYRAVGITCEAVSYTHLTLPTIYSV